MKQEKERVSERVSEGKSERASKGNNIIYNII